MNEFYKWVGFWYGSQLDILIWGMYVSAVNVAIRLTANWIELMVFDLEH